MTSLFIYLFFYEEVECLCFFVVCLFVCVCSAFSSSSIRSIPNTFNFPFRPDHLFFFILPFLFLTVAAFGSSSIRSLFPLDL